MKKIGFIVISIVIASTLGGCDRSPTGTKESDNALYAFNKIVSEHKDQKGFHPSLKHWGLALEVKQTESQTVDKFEWSKDSAANAIDFAMVLRAKPFIEAGLDPDKLAADSGYVYKPAAVEDGKQIEAVLIHPYNLSDKRETAQGSEDAMRRLLKQDPSIVELVEDQQGYRLGLRTGAGFDQFDQFVVTWTNSPDTSDTLISFAIDADPLLAAGLDPKKIEGWSFLPSTSGLPSPNQLKKEYDLK